MARDHHYRPGSFYRIDARTGFAERAERTLKEWTGQIVREQSWEPRQPQDYVRGVVDNQMVPEPRPRLPKMFVPTAITALVDDILIANGIGNYTVGTDAIGSSGALLVVSNAAGWIVSDVVWVMQDNGNYWRAEITDVTGNEVTISPPVPRSVSAGNAVVNIIAQTRMLGLGYPGTIGFFDIGGDEIDAPGQNEDGQAPEGYQNEYVIPFGSPFNNDYPGDTGTVAPPGLVVLVDATGAQLLDANGAPLLAPIPAGVPLVGADGSPLLDANGAQLLSPMGL